MAQPSEDPLRPENPIAQQLELIGTVDTYTPALAVIVELMEAARRAAARSVNAVMTATYWEIGRRIIELEQRGESRAEYGKQIMERLAKDLSDRFGRGFQKSNLFQMRSFYIAYAHLGQALSQDALSPEIFQTLSGKFPLPWSHYVKLMSVKSAEARAFYEAEALRGGWSVRQLSRQINTQYYERALLSRNKAAMLESGSAPRPEDAVSHEEELKDPFILEFLNLKDEYSENDLESALIHHIESFLLELGSDFTFVGRQRRLRIGDQWFRVDLLFFHRRLRCLVIIDLKLGEFTYADAGQMHMYLNYAREHWTYPGENPPVGLILCNKKNEAVAHYSLEGLSNILAAEYQTALPEEKLLVSELERTRKAIENRLTNSKDLLDESE
ncbi:MAG: PDDEXK nuclease domain-containing protein [Oculatellaceae cyanobacterium Prado106]|jgi:predicted nuclease of restriction endonuclease-like (RecB) superfamily|nr:PDDEXK nuclease domain-containing protein [Oculatellaceae cyanobacterium Prado106]